MSISNCDKAKSGLEVIMDADTGSDDAMAIFLMLSPLSNAEILAITSTIGNSGVVNTTRNTLKVLETVDRLEIPVFMGSVQGLVYSEVVPRYFGEDGFGDMDPDLKPSLTLAQKQHAAYAIAEIINRRPGCVSVLCMGPLTNLAIALQLNPQLLEKTKDVFIMGGSLNEGSPFNYNADPEAAEFVFSKVPNGKQLVLFPGELVRNSSIPMDWRLNDLGAIDSELMKLMNFTERNTFEQQFWLPFDQMTAACLLDPSLITKEELFHVRVETCGDTRGHFFIDRNRTDPNVKMITGFDTEKFKQMLLKFFS